MHELYIADCILNVAARALPSGVAAGDVSEICVRVGKLDAIVPESLEFLFDAIKMDKGFGSAVLRITETQVECHCRSCPAHFTVGDDLTFACPECGSVRVNVVSGRGIQLTELTINDPAEA